MTAGADRGWQRVRSRVFRGLALVALIADALGTAAGAPLVNEIGDVQVFPHVVSEAPSRSGHHVETQIQVWNPDGFFGSVEIIYVDQTSCATCVSPVLSLPNRVTLSVLVERNGPTGEAEIRYRTGGVEMQSGSFRCAGGDGFLVVRSTLPDNVLFAQSTVVDYTNGSMTSVSPLH